jgi:hypothetical protein
MFISRLPNGFQLNFAGLFDCTTKIVGRIEGRRSVASIPALHDKVPGLDLTGKPDVQRMFLVVFLSTPTQILHRTSS